MQWVLTLGLPDRSLRLGCPDVIHLSPKRLESGALHLELVHLHTEGCAIRYNGLDHSALPFFGRWRVRMIESDLLLDCRVPAENHVAGIWTSNGNQRHKIDYSRSHLSKASEMEKIN